MKRVIIIHGYEGVPDDAWKPWLKKELMKLDFEVKIPSMPDPYHPRKDAWVSKISETVGLPDDSCYLVGHSLGCIAILRYLESLPQKVKIGRVFMVAGFTTDLDLDELETFFQNKINWDKIKSHCDQFVAINSKTDPYVSLDYADIFKKNLGAKVIIENDMGHFGESDGIKEIPSLLEAITTS